jgi:N utilization substance protein B
MENSPDHKAEKHISGKVKSRIASRVLAVQCLYAYYNLLENNSTPGLSLEQLMLNILHSSPDLNRFDPAYEEVTVDYDKKLFSYLVTGTVESLPDLDARISERLAEGWRLERIPQVVKAILRIAMYEIQTSEDLSSAAIINEYLEIAKMFNHEEEAAFINGILDKGR